MQYLAGVKPNALWPADARARGDIMRWQCWSLAHWGSESWTPLVFQNIVKAVFDMGPPDEAAVAAATEAFHRDAAHLETYLTRQLYLAGDAVTLADFSVAAPLFYADRAKLPVASHAKVRDWFARVSALPAWRETAPQMPAAA
jgi:glutathione S-transferase